MNNQISEKTAKTLLGIHAVTLNLKKPYQFASGIYSPVYTDCRILMSYPKERGLIRNLYIETLQSTGITFDVIAGTATAGIPHAAWVAEKLNLPMIYVRGKAKDHGKGNQIEGVLKKDQNVAVIEDLISTGESAAETAKAIREAGGIANYVFAIITYGMKKSLDTFKTNDIELISLTDFSTLVTVAKNEGHIQEKDMESILDWTKDPATWGKRMGFE